VEFTLDELTAEVAARLAGAGYAQGNGQVSPVPDRRTLRYYTTIGLLDRPLAIRDRQAIYGERHVLQAVAVKRLQATGRSLADIQAELAGLPTDQLAAVVDQQSIAPRRSARFWADSAPVPLATPRADGGAATIHRAPDAPSAAAPAFRAPPTAAAPAASGEPAGLRSLIAVPLVGEVTLLVPAERPLTPDDVAAVRQAAVPLLGYLNSAGLVGPQVKERL
jgi:DNA-binding transcriptional MerR regulator